MKSLVSKERRESFRRMKKAAQAREKKRKEERLSYITPGIYRHYAGKLYYVFFTARHTETGEELVIYLPLYAHREGGHVPQARPLKMWFTPMPTRENPMLCRFTYIGATLPPNTKEIE